MRTTTSKLLMILGLLTSCHLIQAQNVPSYVPTNGLVGWWPFNGNANDASGNGNNGTVNGATLATDRFGAANCAYSFNGINNRIDLPTNLNGALVNSTAFSISGYFLLNNQNPNGESIFSNWKAFPLTDPFGINIGISDKFSSSNCAGTGVFTQDTISTNLWSHFAVVFDGSQSNAITKMKVFINGVQMMTDSGANVYSNFTVANSLGSQATNSAFGAWISQFGWVGFFEGKLDDIGIWNRALTQQEISNLFNASTSIPVIACPGSQIPFNLTNGLVGWWPFCGDADDESGNGNDGTVNGATLTSDRFGNAYSAYDFDGIDDFIWAGLVDSLNGAPSATVSYWTNTDLNFSNNGIGNYGTAIGHWKDNGQFNGPIGLQVTHMIDGSINASLIGAQGASTLPQMVNPLQWSHITIVFDGLKVDSERVACYVNGSFIQYINVLNAPTSLGVEATRTYFGAACGPTGPLNAWAFFHGILDDIGIWNRALDSSEVNQLYNNNVCVQQVPGSCDTLVFNAVITSWNPVTYANHIKVYPNPAQTDLVIDCGTNYTGLSGYSIRINNLLGQTLYNSPITSQLTNISLTPPTWVNGTYVVQFLNPNGTVIDAKTIIVQ